MANLPFLPDQGESLDLKSGRFRSQKTGRYTRRVDLENIVVAIKDTLKRVVSIDQKMGQLVKSAELINTNIVSLGDLVSPKKQPPKDAKSEKREAISSVKEKAKKAGFSVIGLVALIALLKNDKLMAIVKGFFTGFLEGLGFSKEAIEKIKFWVGFAVNAFKVYLGFRVFKQVYEAFMAVKRLGELMGILGKKNQDASGLLAERETILKTRETLAQKATKMKDAFKAAAEKAQARVKSITKILTSKDELIKVKNKAIASTKATLTKSINTIKQKFSNFKKLIMNGIKLIRGAVKITTLAASLPSFGLSLLIGAAVDAVLMTALDYFMAEDDAKPDASGMLGNLAKNFVESITFGFINGDKLKEMVVAGAKKLFGWFQKAWDWFAGSDDKKKESTKPAAAKAESKASAASKIPSPVEMAKKVKPNLTKEEFDKEYKFMLNQANLQADKTYPQALTKMQNQVWAEYQKLYPVAGSVKKAPSSPATKEVGVAGLQGVQQGGKSGVPGSAGSSPLMGGNTGAPAAPAAFATASNMAGMFSGMPSAGSDNSLEGGKAMLGASQLEAPPSQSQGDIGAISEEVTMDKKKAMQVAAMSSQTIINNRSITNVSSDNQLPMSTLKPTMALFSDTVGF